MLKPVFSKYRFVLTWVLAAVLVAALTDKVRQAVQQVKEAAKPAGLGAASADLGIINFTLQAKILIGTLEELEAHTVPRQAETQSELAAPLIQQFANTWLQVGGREPALAGLAQPSPGLLQRQYILARHLGLSVQAEGLLREFKTRFPKVTGLGREIMQRLEQGYQPANRAFGLAPQEGIWMQTKLGWFGEVFAADAAQNSGHQAFSTTLAARQAVQTYRRAMLALAIAGLTGVLGLLAGIVMIWQLKSKPAAYVLSPIPGHYFLEMFGLYFGLMFLLEVVGLKVLPAAGTGMSIFGRLLVNAGGIIALLLILFWPLLFGIKAGTLWQSLGLAGYGPRTVLADIGAGVTGYLACIPAVAVALLVNFYLLSKLGLDMTAGMHPLVPLLLKNRDAATLGMALLLAAGVAPIVEEIMFRGALFNWLRSRMRAGLAVLLSALVFASVHPQGVFGFLPIAVIGCVLAGLRARCHRLLPCMIMHACVNASTFLLVIFLFAD